MYISKRNSEINENDAVNSGTFYDLMLVCGDVTVVFYTLPLCAGHASFDLPCVIASSRHRVTAVLFVAKSEVVCKIAEISEVL